MRKSTGLATPSIAALVSQTAGSGVLHRSLRRFCPAWQATFAVECEPGASSSESLLLLLLLLLLLSTTKRRRPLRDRARDIGSAGKALLYLEGAVAAGERALASRPRDC